MRPSRSDSPAPWRASSSGSPQRRPGYRRGSSSERSARSSPLRVLQPPDLEQSEQPIPEEDSTLDRRRSRGVASGKRRFALAWRLYEGVAPRGGPAVPGGRVGGGGERLRRERLLLR